MAVIYIINIIETKCDNVVLIGLHSVNMCTYCIVVGVILVPFNISGSLLFPDTAKVSVSEITNT